VERDGAGVDVTAREKIPTATLRRVDSRGRGGRCDRRWVLGDVCWVLGARTLFVLSAPVLLGGGRGGVVRPGVAEDVLDTRTRREEGANKNQRGKKKPS
jgi:hypothetical protein